MLAGVEICGGGVFDFGDERRANDSGIGKAAENGDVAGEGDAEADGDGKLRDFAGATQKRWEIVGECVFRAGDASAGDEIEKTGGRGGDFGETLVGGCGSTKENRVEMMRG